MLAQQLYKLTTSPMKMVKWLIHTLQKQQNWEQSQEENVYFSVRELLIKIDKQVFSELTEQQVEVATFQQNFMSFLAYLQRYLCKKQFKKLKASFQLRLRQTTDVNELLKLVLYLCINSNLRKEIVNKIIYFQEEEQRYLMNAIKQIQRECEQLVQLKKVIEKVMFVEAANQQLKVLYNQNQASLQAQIAEFNETQLENKSLADQIQGYQKEKNHAFIQISSNSLQDYEFQCRKVKIEVECIHSKLYDSNNENQILLAKSQALKKELKAYGKCIKQHIQQLDRLKSQYKLANEENMLREIPQIKNGEALTLLPLRKLSKNNFSSNLSQEQPRKIDTQRTNCQSDKEQSFSRTQNKCNLGLLSQISYAEKQYEQKVKFIQKLKLVQKLQKQRYDRFTKKLQKLKKENQNQINMYQIQTVKLCLGK